MEDREWGQREIVERFETDDGILRCFREGEDPAELYWDVDKQAIVVVKNGKIVTFFPPDEGFDYWLDECNR